MRPTSTRQEAEHLRGVALSAARTGAAVLKRHAGRVGVGDWEGKRRSDYVTFVDREAERAILNVIREAFPGHDVMAEEGTPGTALADVARRPGEVLAEATHPIWVIDPLDGTTNFLHGYPAYAVSVAVVVEGEPHAAAVVDGHTGEAWTAAAGAGAERDGCRLQVSEIDRFEHALLGTGFPFKTPARIPEHLRILDAALRATSGVRRAGSAALDLCHVAAGYLDGFFELELAPWDVAAGVLLVREAGGVVTDFTGSSEVWGGGGVLAGNAAIHSRLRALVREASQ